MTDEQTEKLVADIVAIVKFGGMGDFPESGKRYLRLAIKEAQLPSIPQVRWAPQPGSDQLTPVYQYQQPFWMQPNWKPAPQWVPPTIICGAAGTLGSLENRE